MNTKDLERLYGSRKNAIQQIGIYRQLWDAWERNGIPPGRQAILQIATRGKLTANGVKKI